MTTDRLRLDDQLCFALYAATNAVVRTYRPLLRELGLTYPQYLALMNLWQHGESTVGELAARLQLPAHGLTPVLQRLEQVGFVSRRRDPRDARTVRITLTTAGAELETSAAAAQQQVVCATGLDAVDLAALRTELHALVDQLGTATAHPNEGTAS